MYMLRGYHSLSKAGTLYTPQWMKMPSFNLLNHFGWGNSDRDCQLSL